MVDWTKLDKTGKALNEVANAIKILITDLKIKPTQAVTSLPEDEVVSRLIDLPLKESEVRDALKFEAETFVPTLDQVSIDYEVLDQDESGRLTVFAIAARK